jgi:DNA-binding transcriptional MocR family regulator
MPSLNNFSNCSRSSVERCISEFCAEGRQSLYYSLLPCPPSTTQDSFFHAATELVEAIHKQLGDKFEVIGTEAGMHLVALLPPDVSDEAISRRAAEMGISAMPLSSCYAKPPVRGGLILGYGGTDERQIHDGIRRLKMTI